MIDSLTRGYKLKGLKSSELISLLGEPNFEDSVSIGYKIKEKYGNDIDPIYTKYLVFTISEDHIITSFQIGESTK